MKRNNEKIKERLCAHLKQHWLMYLCQSIFMTISVVIGVIAYSLIMEKQDCKEDTTQEPVAIKVFLNENDTIIPALSSEIKEMKNMMQKMQKDTLCVIMTKGNK